MVVMVVVRRALWVLDVARTMAADKGCTHGSCYYVST